MRTATVALAVVSLLACVQAPAPAVPVERADAEVFDYDVSAPLDATLHETVEGDGFRRLDLSFASPRGGRVPAYVWEPTTPGPHAGMIAMHGMPGDRSSPDWIAERYVRAGAVVISISAPWARPEVRPGVLRFDSRDAQEQIQLIVDLRRAVDWLLAHGEVDAERIGYVGVSYGGAMGGLLAGVEKRIRAYALAVGDGGLVDHFDGPGDENGPFSQLPPARVEAWIEAMRPIEPLLWVSDAAPSALLFQNARDDSFVPEVDGLAYQQAGSEPKTTLWYDTDHGLPPEAWADQQNWFAEHLGTAPASG